MKMTKIDALNTAIAILSESNEYDAATEILQKMVTQLSKPRTMSDEAKAKRKEKTAQARAELMAQVLPVALTGADGFTAKELYERCRDDLPEDFTANKVQYILLHELAEEVAKNEIKGKANTYKIAQ